MSSTDFAVVAEGVLKRYGDTRALDGFDLAVPRGTVCGLLGPNGAGKTTTLKMLSGLLYPTGGEATVLGHVPWRREGSFLRGMTLLMGNRSQLVWDIPAADSFLVLKEIYAIPEPEYRRVLDELTGLLELESLLHKPVRGLSLGERMKVEFAAGLLHSPGVAFLDEPTLGLDISMQGRIRRFVAEYNQRTGATILLTSHYMDDVVALCRRVIVIHHGVILYDGALADLAERMAPYKRITVTLRGTVGDLSSFGDVVSTTENTATIHVPRTQAGERTARLVRELGDKLADISVEDPPIEEVIDKVFSSERPLAATT
jgi:ABC-2 type transport system ATP-binding protein